MATQVESDEALSPSRKKYEWDLWLNKKVWVGKRGEDWTCQDQSFISQLYKAAYERGLLAHVTPLGDGRIRWYAYDPPAKKDNAA